MAHGLKFSFQFCTDFLNFFTLFVCILSIKFYYVYEINREISLKSLPVSLNDF